jgi:hypothetical protein
VLSPLAETNVGCVPLVLFETRKIKRLPAVVAVAVTVQDKFPVLPLAKQALENPA